MNRSRPGKALALAGTIAASLTTFASASPIDAQAGPRSKPEGPGGSQVSSRRVENMFDVGGRRLHSFTYGTGSPTVVLVSGLEIPQDYWDSVVPSLAAAATVVTYDRAGVGKSELGDLPAHGEQSAKDLRVLLEQLGVPKPYLLVGHSFGGNVVRLFASRYQGDVGGLVLEETQHENILEEMRKILRGKDLATFDEVLAPGFEAPENPKTERDYRNATKEQIRGSGPLPEIPFVILTCADRARAMQSMFSEAAIEELAERDAALMNKLAASVPGGRQIMVEGTGHHIHVDKPQALIAPVMEMIGALKASKRD